MSETKIIYCYAAVAVVTFLATIWAVCEFMPGFVEVLR